LQPYDWVRDAIRVSTNAAKHAGHTFTDRRHTYFLTLALAGEVGELCNLIKKWWRDDKLNPEYKEEMADVYIYLRLLAEQLGVDLDFEARKKMEKVKTRPFAKP
jgi:NTP pyrophosphatase (non-canonical NTP hydrolase)